MSKPIVWTKEQAAALANETGTVEPISTAKKRYIMIVCRSLSSIESRVLSKNFKNIISFDHNLHAANTDLNALTFDLLMINISNKEAHLFLEIVSPQAKALNIPIIVVKKTLSNYKKLVSALGAYVVSKIEDLDGDQFISFLLKEKLPKLDNRFTNLFKSCFSFVSNL